MTYTTYNLDNFSVPLPIAQAARTIAQKFANQQPTPEKAAQVRLNTLAVLVVNDYLQMMEIETNLSAGDSWNPAMRLFADIADLVIPGLGRLECRPVGVLANTCAVPPETWEERIGYIVIQIDESLQEAKLLGFVASVDTEELSLSKLKSPEAFIEHLAQLKLSSASKPVNLSQWFAGIFESSWQTVEALWNSQAPELAYGFRGPETFEQETSHRLETITRRAKLMDFGIQIADKPLMLIVELCPQANDKTHIRLQLHPTGKLNFLPAGVQLTVLDDSGAVFLEAQARSADNYIQLQFRGVTKEIFSVRVAFNDISITEQFVI
ncbi:MULTISPECIES: DUF1822 family protein [unclassified Tolypothrix]|uniref:DUF1822 family protein n=1 Tax=unclassified Tolypothrix TaxID=2649714 RepID=UPI0005EAA36C|nr:MULTISPECIES: DUF1822 family protein [unclassified Tolypothrix]BAY90377.1 hypothetical protein NIES3275_23930 [Microchaete diplosiphon NIES-3275]EKE98621.1 hypothetical protein FDUTEX481_03638 [Tolypothrix sp. PCC 7601]MBE9084268.1 DUF1822 family protein [Tolypothrix sp. LEGE 11397]UYD24555.1 DUF1822 family protein [Tolypothrix sp. PCC 7712]UYD33216.1 DUF1822 family protein [Tolypothrix sp. PCC 7601]